MTMMMNLMRYNIYEYEKKRHNNNHNNNKRRFHNSTNTVRKVEVAETVAIIHIETLGAFGIG